ncbi:hypothetical protein BS47DRAFT_1345448 [Hydnum rufescens UP504]|uniref:Uncharacterized protein n=1 Tax=Hydnum rufescens UP504 TaxID=1448309 RepID=A0A9P6AV29_9AGAM|nr:hypothetical protein BS47DRAFT_1345448 [Hydnum rufescens UP504]
MGMRADEIYVREGDLQLIPEGILPHHGTMGCLEGLRLWKTKRGEGNRKRDEVNPISFRWVSQRPWCTPTTQRSYFRIHRTAVLPVLRASLPSCLSYRDNLIRDHSSITSRPQAVYMRREQELPLILCRERQQCCPSNESLQVLLRDPAVPIFGSLTNDSGSSQIRFFFFFCTIECNDLLSFLSRERKTSTFLTVSKKASGKRACDARRSISLCSVLARHERQVLAVSSREGGYFGMCRR